MNSRTPRRLLSSGIAGPLLVISCSGSSPAEPASNDAAIAEPAETADDSAELAQQATCPGSGEEWEVAKLYIEHNATDEDTGVHGVFGGEAWSELCISDPDGNQIFLVDPQAQLGNLTVSAFVFESREPPASEYSVADLMADFPEGTYHVSGTDFEGTPRAGEATFTHAIPAEPNITSPSLVEDPEVSDQALVPDGDLLVIWDAVTETIFEGEVTITGYELIVTTEEFEDPNGLSRPIYDVHVPASFTELVVPDQFLLPGTIYELEVLALEESGNQTISVGFFATS